MEWLTNPEIWASLLTLTALEIVLGIDNIVLIAVVASSLPERERDRARFIGLSVALITRLLLLFTITWMAGLTRPLFQLWDHPFSGRDLIMLAGGMFLMVKAVREIHHAVEEAGEPDSTRRAGTFRAAVAQIVVLDIIFSLDSVITAVGMARELWVMVTAVVVSVAVMLAASGPIIDFVHRHPTVKMLALAFVLLIGTALVAEGFAFHIPKGYLYFAMAFSVLVEALNVAVAGRRRRARARAARGASNRCRACDCPHRCQGCIVPPDLIRQRPRRARERSPRLMTYVVTEACIKCKYMDCVEVCPVDCFYEGETMLVIKPDECIDCGVCEPECPAEAIVPDTDPGAERWVEVNRQYADAWPNITRKSEAPADADQFKGVEGKFEQYFSPNPAKR